MPHITLPEGYPGIRSLFIYSRKTALLLKQRVQVLLHDKNNSTLSPGERELIAACTSSLNGCKYRAATRGAIAKHQLGDDQSLVRQVTINPETAEISNKLRALLRSAAKVQQGGREVTQSEIERASAIRHQIRKFMTQC